MVFSWNRIMGGAAKASLKASLLVYRAALVSPLRGIFRLRQRVARMSEAICGISATGPGCRFAHPGYSPSSGAHSLNPAAPSANASRLSQVMTMWSEQARQLTRQVNNF
jgi:hypothetical protein